MAGSNGASPELLEHSDATGVFGRVGQAMPLGEVTVTIRILVNRDIKAQKLLLDALSWTPDDETPGEQFYGGAASQDKWEALAAWLALWCTPEVTVEMLESATADETIALIDAIFEQSGLLWLRRSLGKRTEQVRALMETRLSQPIVPAPSSESEPGGEESPSTLSTDSSSTSPDRPPKRGSISPSTG